MSENDKPSKGDGDGRNYIWLEKKITDRSDGMTISDVSVCIKSNEPLDKIRKAAREDLKMLIGDKSG